MVYSPLSDFSKFLLINFEFNRTRTLVSFVSKIMWMYKLNITKKQTLTPNHMMLQNGHTHNDNSATCCRIVIVHVTIW